MMNMSWNQELKFRPENPYPILVRDELLMSFLRKHESTNRADGFPLSRE